MRTVNVEPSWIAIADMAINLMESGNAKEGKSIIREMGQSLADMRATQDDCPDHLKEGARWGPDRDAYCSLMCKIVTRRGWYNQGCRLFDVAST